MSLPALAVKQDVIDRSPRALESDELARVDQLLLSASTKVRNWTRRDFTINQSVIITPTIDNQLLLPQKPVISIESVGRMNPDGLTYVTYAVWTFDGIDRIMLASPNVIANAPEWWTDADWFWRNITYRVQYTHGYSVIPDDVIDVVCEMVIRTVTKPGTYGAQSEMIGGYSYRLQSGYPSGAVQLTDDDKDTLRQYRGVKNRTIELR